MLYKSFIFQQSFPGAAVRLEVHLAYILEGQSTTHDPLDFNVRILEIGDIETAYEMSDFSLVPSSLELSFTDSEKSWYDQLFDNEYLSLKDCRIVMWSEYPDGSLVNEFDGNIVPDSISFDVYSRELTFTAATRFDVINEMLLYSPENAAFNPFHFTGERNETVKITDLIKMIYQKVTPEIESSDITFTLPYTYFGRQKATYLNATGVTTFEETDDIPSSELRITTRPFFFDTNRGLRNVGDVLRKVAFDLGCFTGIIGRKVFFKHLLTAGKSGGRIISERNILSFEKLINRFPTQYVKITEGTLHPISIINPDAPDDVNKGGAQGWITRYWNSGNPPYYDCGTPSNYDDYNVEKNLFTAWQIVHWKLFDGQGAETGWVDRYESDLMYLPDGVTIPYAIWKVNTDATKRLIADHLAEVWHKFLAVLGTKTYILELAGVDYSFTQNIIFDGVSYMPIRLTKNYVENTTIIEAISE